ncbi:MAG: YbjN domain-containing protein [Bifidobacteriaceae bacterium]|jgi:hypothetical protein|nr:YbjN domain-containing protein [Bifidobacteriaceae bacterium]
MHSTPSGNWDDPIQQPSDTTGDVVAPLSRERIAAAMQAERWNYLIDDEGDIGGLLESNLFYFFLYGEANEILQVRGRWHQQLPISMRSQVRQALDDWHFSKIWPKAYTTVDDVGRMWVLAEHSVDWEEGVTDRQLRLTLRCAANTSLSLFHYLEDQLVTIGPKGDTSLGWRY